MVNMRSILVLKIYISYTNGKWLDLNWNSSVVNSIFKLLSVYGCKCVSFLFTLKDSSVDILLVEFCSVVLLAHSN